MIRAMIRSWVGSASVYFERRVLSMLFFGFTSGLPLLLVYSTLSAWLTEVGISKTAIGFISLVGTAYALKFLWSPIVDKMPVPILTRLLGRRRSWMLVSQAVLIVAIYGMAGSNPETADGLWWMIFWAVVVAFASATQDIVIDAYRTEILDDEKLGAGAANLVFGYRVAMLLAGGGSLIIADFAGWSVAYMVMAGLVLIGVATVLVNPEPAARTSREMVVLEKKGRDFLERNGHLPGAVLGVAAWIYAAVVCPFAEFMSRRGWIPVLLFVALYKYGDALLGVMAIPFYLEMGFSKTEIGAISKGFGLAMTLIGAGLGGLMVARYGILRALLVCGVLQAASNLVFAVQAWVGYSVPMLMVTIATENLSGGMGTTAFVAYLSSLTNVAYTATQYALLSSLMAFARTIFASGSGWLADQMDWVGFFLVTTLAALPGLILLIWMLRTFPAESQRRSGDILAEPD
jgi:PAT family beta-lactamase induction signal transducer AmpG